MDLQVLVAIIDWDVFGVDLEVMGIGPIPAIRKLLEQTHIKKEDISLFEINEAFVLGISRRLFRHSDCDGVGL